MSHKDASPASTYCSESELFFKPLRRSQRLQDKATADEAEVIMTQVLTVQNEITENQLTCKVDKLKQVQGTGSPQLFNETDEECSQLRLNQIQNDAPMNPPPLGQQTKTFSSSASITRPNVGSVFQSEATKSKRKRKYTPRSMGNKSNPQSTEWLSHPTTTNITGMIIDPLPAVKASNSNQCVRETAPILQSGATQPKYRRKYKPRSMANKSNHRSTESLCQPTTTAVAAKLDPLTAGESAHSYEYARETIPIKRPNVDTESEFQGTQAKCKRKYKPKSIASKSNHQSTESTVAAMLDPLPASEPAHSYQYARETSLIKRPNVDSDLQSEPVQPKYRRKYKPRSMANKSNYRSTESLCQPTTTAVAAKLDPLAAGEPAHSHQYARESNSIKRPNVDSDLQSEAEQTKYRRTYKPRSVRNQNSHRFASTVPQATATTATVCQTSLERPSHFNQCTRTAERRTQSLLPTQYPQHFVHQLPPLRERNLNNYSYNGRSYGAKLCAGIKTVPSQQNGINPDGTSRHQQCEQNADVKVEQQVVEQQCSSTTQTLIGCNGGDANDAVAATYCLQDGFPIAATYSEAYGYSPNPQSQSSTTPSLSESLCEIFGTNKVRHVLNIDEARKYRLMEMHLPVVAVMLNVELPRLRAVLQLTQRLTVEQLEQMSAELVNYSPGTQELQ